MTTTSTTPSALKNPAPFSSPESTCSPTYTSARPARYPPRMKPGALPAAAPGPEVAAAGRFCSLNAIGVRTFRADTPTDLLDAVSSAATLAFEADQQIAVLISQRMIGAKKW